MKKIFFDTEFTSLSQVSELISIAFVTECGLSFYAEFNDFDQNKCNEFVQQNIIPALNKKAQKNTPSEIFIIGNSNEIKEAIEEWLLQFDQIQMWADVPNYDWVLFSELFGGTENLPKNMNYTCFDLNTLLFSKGFDSTKSRIELVELNKRPKNFRLHNSLSDAQLGMILLKQLLNIT